MNPHTRTRDDLVDHPGENDVTHPFQCIKRSGKSRMELVVVITAYNEPWKDKDGGDMQSTSMLGRYSEHERSGLRSYYDSHLHIFVFL